MKSLNSLFTLGLLLVCLGAALVVSSLSMEAFSDWDEFKRRAIDPRDSAIYFQVRRELLTPKFKLIDHGVQLVLTGVLLLFVRYRFNGKLYMASSRKSTILLAIFLPFVSVSGFTFDLFQGQARWEFPPWADSLAIPLIGLPMALIILMIVSAFIMLFSKRSRAELLEINEVINPHINPILAILLMAFIALTAILAYEGVYWLSIPALFWSYLIVSVTVQRIRFKVDSRSDTSNSPRHEA